MSEPDGIWVRRARLYPGQPPAPASLGFTLLDEPLRQGRLLEADLVAQTARDGWRVEAWADLLPIWFTALQEHFGLPRRLDPTVMVPARAIDALPRNLVIPADGHAVFIDQEWQPEGELPFGYLCFRALLQALFAVEQCAPGADGQSAHLLPLIAAVFAALGWDLPEADVRDYVSREAALRDAIITVPYLTFKEAQTYRLRIRPDFALLDRARSKKRSPLTIALVAVAFGALVAAGVTARR